MKPDGARDRIRDVITPRASLGTVVAAFAAAAGASLIAYGHLPPRVAMQYGFDGLPARYGSALEAAVAMPSVLAALVVATVLTFRIARDPELRPRILGTLAFSGLLIAGVHMAILLMAAGWPVDVLRLSAFGMFLFAAGLGSLLPGTPRNGWFGIRTPATFRSPEVWRRAHEIAGRLYRRLGAAGALVSLLPLPGAGLLLAALILLIAAPLLAAR